MYRVEQVVTAIHPIGVYVLVKGPVYTLYINGELSPSDVLIPGWLRVGKSVWPTIEKVRISGIVFRVYCLRSQEMHSLKEHIVENLDADAGTMHMVSPPVSVRPMSTHDHARLKQAEACDENDLESLSAAVRGLQSADHLSLIPLRERLQTRLQEMRGLKK